MQYSTRFIFTTIPLLLLASGMVSAHETTEGAAGGFLSGFQHPLLGWDHLAAMVAVGLWGAFLGAPSIWLLPVAFPLVMALGGALALLGMPLPGVEIGIALSAAILGLLVLLAVRMPVAAAALIVAIFAMFHGYAHGQEMPDAANPVAYAIGFVVATGLLHIAGIAFGLLARWPQGRLAVRLGGGVIFAAGLFFLYSIFS